MINLIKSNYWHVYFDSRPNKLKYAYNKGAFINGHKWAHVVSSEYLNENSVKQIANYFNEKFSYTELTYSQGLDEINNKFIIKDKTIKSFRI